MKSTVGIVLGILISISLAFQLWQVHKFINAGPRFTAQDGQALCERIAELERYSIGFQQSGIVSPPCNYIPK